MQSKFLAPNNKLLYKKSKPIKQKDFKEKWFLGIVNEMKQVAGLNQNHKTKNKPTMVGLAAPQIGFPHQIVFVDASATAQRDPDRKVNNVFMINPKILEYSDKKIINREGCYSTMTDSFSINGIVERSDKVKLSYLDEFGSKQIRDFEGFTSVIVQHEVDHLNGKVFVHHVKNEKNLHIVFNSEVDLYKQNYKKWKRTLDPTIYFKDVCGL